MNFLCLFKHHYGSKEDWYWDQPYASPPIFHWYVTCERCGYPKKTRTDRLPPSHINECGQEILDLRAEIEITLEHHLQVRRVEKRSLSIII